MSYKIKEIFYSLQGEGANSGKPAIFCRFSGCNLWSGREIDRKKAKCNFCDTDFVGTNGSAGGNYSSAELLADKINSHWPKSKQLNKFIVFTGGEPLLQLDKELIKILRKMNFYIALETNGTIPTVLDIDWICVSPKSNSLLKITEGNEIKIVFPQKKLNPEDYLSLNFQHKYLQPMDGNNLSENVVKTIDYVLSHPEWKISLQSHKYIGIK